MLASSTTVMSDELILPNPTPAVPRNVKVSVNTWLTNNGGKGQSPEADVAAPQTHSERGAAAISHATENVSKQSSVEQPLHADDYSLAERSNDEQCEDFLRRLQERTGLNVYADAGKRRSLFARNTTSTSYGTKSTSLEPVERQAPKGSLTFALVLAMWVLDPWERPYYVCLLISSIAVLYNIFIIIARVTFDFLEDYWLIWIVLDYVSDLIYIFDILCQSRKGCLKDGILDTNYKTVIRRYLCSWNIIIDVLAILPTEFLVYLNPTFLSRTALRFNRLLKAPRLFEWLDRTWRISKYPIIVRLCTLVLYYVICLHWNACVYFEICKRVGLGSDEWVVDPAKFTNDTQWVGLYLSSMYWSAMRFTNIGEVPPPVTDGEMIFTIIDMLLAIAVFAGIFGGIEELLERAYERVHDYHRWMDDVKKYMALHRVPYAMQRRVYMWMIHCWNRNYFLGSGNSTMDILPDRLQAEINMNAHLNTLRRVRFFQDCEPGLLIALLNKLKLQMFNPGEFICRKGDVGREMYIVKSGRLSVVGADGCIALATLTEGAVFGELSLLNISGAKTGNRRTASIRSNGYTDLFCLSKEDLWAALQDYPDARRVFIKKGRELLIKDGLLDGYVRLDQFALLSQLSQYEAVKGKAEHLVVRMSAMVVGMGANLRVARDRVRCLEHELEKYRHAYRRRKIQVGPDDGEDSE